MTALEHALLIPMPEGDMLGIVSMPVPGSPPQRTAVIIVVGGAQYRVGSHRQFVQLARHLAAAGHPVLRFDLPGMGDSPGELVGFEDTTPHIAAAINAVLTLQCPDVDRVALWGLCDGASASLLYVQATSDPRVAGLALLNPWVRSQASLARTQVKHYYRQRLLEPDFWRKLLAGGVGEHALRGLVQNLRTMRQRSATPSFQERMAKGWQTFAGPILLLLSERDLTAQEFIEYLRASPAWRNWSAKDQLTQRRVPEADHTCSSPGTARIVEAHTSDWMRSL